MPSHYPAIQAQLILDFRDVLGNATEVIFGSVRREVTKPCVIVKTTPEREFEGPRRVVESYTFDIEVRLIPEVANLEYGDEPYLMEQAEYMIDKLSPHDHSDVPAVAGPYAGVGSVRSCTKPKVVDTTDEDGYIAFSFQFYLETTVYQ